jgi:hypothetical protein
MKPRNAEAARLEADYLAHVKAATAGREPSEVDEILESLRELIGEELSEVAGDQITLVQMANVLEQLGPPEDYAQEEGVERTAAAVSRLKADEEGPRLSKLAIAAALCFPGALLAWAITTAAGGNTDIGVVCAGFSLFATALIGLLLGVAALINIRNALGKLRGRAFAWIGVLTLPVLLGWATVSFVSFRSAAREAHAQWKQEIERLNNDVRRAKTNHDGGAAPSPIRK